MAPSDVSRHTLSVLVEDVEGILSRVTGMFSRRGYSIISLVSAQTENPGINRLTIVVDASERIMEQVTKQLNKIVPGHQGGGARSRLDCGASPDAGQGGCE